MIFIGIAAAIVVLIAIFRLKGRPVKTKTVQASSQPNPCPPPTAPADAKKAAEGGGNGMLWVMGIAIISIIGYLMFSSPPAPQVQQTATQKSLPPAQPAPEQKAPVKEQEICSDQDLGLWEGRIGDRHNVIPVRVTKKCGGDVVMEQAQYGNAAFRMKNNNGLLVGDWDSTRPGNHAGKIRLSDSPYAMVGEIEDGGGVWTPIRFSKVH